ANAVGPFIAIGIDGVLAECQLQQRPHAGAVRRIHEHGIAAPGLGPLADIVAIGENSGHGGLLAGFACTSVAPPAWFRNNSQAAQRLLIRSTKLAERA